MSALPETPLLFECRGATLVGIIHPGAGEHQELGVVIVVGGPQFRVGSHRQFVRLARELAARGLSTFRFDCRGMGDSSGTFPGFEDIDADIDAAVTAFTRACPKTRGVVLFGLCDAAAAILMYCRSDPRVRKLVLANPWVRTPAGEAGSYVRHYYGRRLLQASFWRKVLSGGFSPAAALGDFVRKSGQVLRDRFRRTPRATTFIERMLRGLETFRGETLILISERDLTAQEFVDLCRTSPRWRASTSTPAVSVLTIDRADHTFASEEANARSTSAILAWLGRGKEVAPGSAPVIRPGIGVGQLT